MSCLVPSPGSRRWDSYPILCSTGPNPQYLVAFLLQVLPACLVSTPEDPQRSLQYFFPERAAWHRLQGDTPPFPPHLQYATYQLAGPVGVNHTDDLPRGDELHLQRHPAPGLSLPTLRWPLGEPGVYGLRPGWSLGSGSAPAPGDVAGPVPQDTAGAVQV